MPKPQVEWTAAHREELARQYARIGYVAGEFWPAPPENASPDDILALLRSVRDGSGRAGYTNALATLAAAERNTNGS